jgi:acyl carrier protein
VTADRPARIEHVLREVLPRLANYPHLDPDLRLTALGVDSLVAVELLVRLEEEFDIAIPDDELSRDDFATPACIAQLLLRATS